MKHMTFTLKASLLGKLLLAAAMMIGGGSSAWGDDRVIAENNSIATNYSNGTGFSAYKTDDEECIYTSWQTGTIVSDTRVAFDGNQKILISAKYYSSGKRPLRVRLSDSESVPSDWSKVAAKEIQVSNSEYQLFAVEDISEGNYWVRIESSYVKISSIIIKDGTSITSLTFDEDHEPDDFSSLTTPTPVQTVIVKYTAKTGWNSICMPFNLKNNLTSDAPIMDALFGISWSAYTLTSYSDGIIVFSKSPTMSALSANTPYLVYAPNASGSQIVLDNLADIPVTHSANPHSTVDGATFQGTYVRKDYVENDDWYGVTPSGRIMKAGTGAFVRGYRAYFTGVSAPSAGAEVKMFIIGGDDIPTDVGFVKMVDADAKEVYNLAGQRIQKARKGIYIVNGKKVVIK